jgi:glycosyltransferase involved in cell wall biosynthesis
MRILQVIDSLRYGGAQKLLVTLTEEATKQGVGVAVACLSDFSAMPLAPLIEAKGAQVTSFPARRLFSPGRFIALYKYVRTGKFTVIHSHLTYANILSYLVGVLCGVPVVSSLHSTGQDKRHANYVRDNIELWALKHAARVVAVGQSVKQAYELLGQKMIVLPNAAEKGLTLSAGERDEIRKRITGDSARHILISVGRLSPDKCFDDLLRGFALVRKQEPDIALVIAGDGILREDLMTLSDLLGLSNNVFWLGMRNDIPALLAASDVYVSVSKREGMPIALLEGMAAGLPLVVTPVGDTPYLVKEDVGILVPVHQPQEFADAVMALLTDAHRRSALGIKARERAINEYGASKWFENLLRCYQETAIENWFHV